MDPNLMTHPAPAVEPPPAHPAFQRVAALAVRLLEVPAVLVLQRTPDGWSVAAGSGEQAARLAGELLRHAFLLDTERDFLIVPDLEDDAQIAAAVSAPVNGMPRLRFLAAATVAAPAPAQARVWLCLLDNRPRQFRAADRQLLQEFAGLLGDATTAPPLASPAGPAADPAVRTSDLSLILPANHSKAAASPATPAQLEDRVRELTGLNAALRADLDGRSRGSLEHVRFEQLIEGSTDFVGLAALDGKFYYLNRAGQKLVGLDGEEAVRRTRLMDYLMREDRSYFLGTVTPNLMRTGTWEGDFRFRHFKTGASIEVNWTLFLIRDPQTGEPADIAVFTRDITERKKNEAALRESEERFRHLVEQAGEAFFVYDLSGRVIDVNQEACDTLGYSRADLLALSVHEIDVGFDPVKGKERWKQMVPGMAVTMNGTHRRKDGSTFPTEERIAVFRSGSQRLLLALVRDITDRKRAEEAIQQTQEQLEARVNERTAELRAASLENSTLAAAIDSSEIGVIIGDPRQPGNPTVFVNPAFLRLTGFTREEALGANRLFLPGPETDAAELEAMQKALTAQRPYRGTVRGYRKDGTPFWDQVSVIPVFDDAHELINFVGVHADVSAQIGALDALRRSELRFSRMTANVPGMVYQLVLHADGTADFPYVSEGCRELFGQEPKDMRPDACTLLDRIHPEDIGEFLRTLDESKVSGTAWSWEGRYLAADGKEERWLQGAARPESQPGGDTLWDGLLLDTTTRKRAEKEIADRARQAAAVAELGQRALASSDYLSLAQVAAELVTRTLGLEMCVISEILPGQDELVVRASAGFDRDLKGITSPPGKASMAGYAVTLPAPLFIEDLALETRCQINPLWLEYGAKSSLSVVIRGRGQPLGSVCIASREQRHFDSEDVNFLQAVANVLATAVDRSRDDQALRKSEARNAAILETALDPIITIDHEERIVEFNPAAEKTFGYPRAEALNRPFKDLVPAATAAMSERTELPALHANGTQILAELAITRIPVEGSPLFTAYVRDITERKRAEAAINQAKEEAEKADRAKSEFLSRMSHELRTPLNAILGFGQVLQMQKLPGPQNDRVGHIVTAGRHLLGLINEVLDISRIEAGRVELSLEPVSVAEAVSETLDLIRPLAGERGVELYPVAESHPLRGEYIMADRQRFKQVLLNLLSNAVKYNRPGGTVRLDYLEGGDGRLRLHVADTGAGVAEDKLARMFVAFDRLGAENTDVQGTGLGLALSKRLTEAMGGGIGVHSVVGEGTTFWIELPRAQSQVRRVRLVDPSTGAPTAMRALAGSHTLLYIEDNLSNLTLIEHLLADHPEIRLMTAMQGGLGVDLARQHHPNLILLDLHLPDVPGWEVLAQLKADPATREIPVVIVSADATPRQVERLMKAGAHSYLTKPLEVERFQRTLRQVLEPEVA